MLAVLTRALPQMQMDEERMRRDNDVQGLQVLKLFSLALTNYPQVYMLGLQYNNASILQRKTARSHLFVCEREIVCVCVCV